MRNELNYSKNGFLIETIAACMHATMTNSANAMWLCAFSYHAKLSDIYGLENFFGLIHAMPMLIAWQLQNFNQVWIN